MHKIAAVTIWISLVFASVIAFQLFVAVDEAQPAGTRTAFHVDRVDSATKAAALEAVDATARDLDVNIFKVQPDLHDAMQARVLFAFVGNPAGFAAHGGYEYPAFSTQSFTTRVVPGTTITTEDLRGRYVTDASDAQLSDILTALSNAGIAASNANVHPLGLLLYSAGSANLVGPAAVMAVALALAISYSVARQRKIFALGSLHGYRRLSSIGAQVAAASAVVGMGVAGLLIVGVPLLALYNGLRQAGRFVSVVAATFLVVYLLVTVLVVLSVLTLPTARTTAVLKGEQISVRNAVIAAIAHVAVVAIMVATASAAMNRIEAVSASLAVSSQWTKGGDLYVLRASPAVTTEDYIRDAPKLATVIRELERSNQVVLAGDKGGNVPDRSLAPDDPEGVNSLLVNNGYLQRQEVRDSQGRRIENLPGGKDQFTLLIPASHRGDRGALLKEYTEYFKDFACTSFRIDQSFACDPRGRIVTTAPGQNLFAYNGTDFLPAEMQTRTLLHDPVLAVVSAQSELIAPFEYHSYASIDDVLFSDPAALERALKEQGIAGNFMGIDNAADAVTTSIALAQRALHMDVVSLVLGWAVLIVSTMVMVAVYCDRRKRPLFVELIHGYSYASRHQVYLAVSVALSLAGVGLAGAFGENLVHGRDWGVAALFVAAQLALALFALKVYEARFRADFIKRY